MNAFDWLMDYSDALGGEFGPWWQQRAEQHAAEIFADEIPGKWWTWRNVRQRESEPMAVHADAASRVSSVAAVPEEQK